MPQGTAFWRLQHAHPQTLLNSSTTNTLHERLELRPFHDAVEVLAIHQTIKIDGITTIPVQTNRDATDDRMRDLRVHEQTVDVLSHVPKRLIAKQGQSPSGGERDCDYNRQIRVVLRDRIVDRFFATFLNTTSPQMTGVMSIRFRFITPHGPRMASEKIGKFIVLETLGAGAHSSILRIRRESDGREYALKLVPIDDPEDKKFLDQAKFEFDIGQRLHHPNVLKVFLFETESNWMFKVVKAKLLLEYVPGKTLDQVPIVNPAKLIDVFKQIAAGLVHFHERHVIHNDIKPNNIMLGRGGQVKIIDFGLAWIKGEPKGRVQGTPEYMAPETGTHKLVNERTEIYNFGATMYRLTTMRLPPMAIPRDGFDVDEKKFKLDLVPPHEINKAIPLELSKLIRKCLKFDALKRPQSMAEIHEYLEKLSQLHPHEEES
jgi:serine/threonine protein kinase